MRSAGEWRAPSLGDPSGDRRRGLDRDLLAKDRAHGDLEGVPRARGANAGMGGGRAAQENVARQLLGNQRRIGAEIEHPPDALDDRQ